MHPPLPFTLRFATQCYRFEAFSRTDRLRVPITPGLRIGGGGDVCRRRVLGHLKSLPERRLLDFGVARQLHPYLPAGALCVLPEALIPGPARVPVGVTAADPDAE